MKKGSNQTEESKELIRNYRIGRHHTVETKDKISKAIMGKKHSDVTKKKISESMKRLYAELNHEKVT